MNETPILTEFDNMIQNDHNQLLKAALPYFQTNGQRILSFYLKYQELRNTMSLFNSEENTLHSCSMGKKNMSTTEMLNDIKKFCSGRDRETIESMLNFINMYSMYNTYSQAFKGGDDGDSQKEMLKSMLTPEQRNIFETILS